MAKQPLGVNPWTKIWVAPRKTIQEILNYNPKHRFAILSFLYGLPMLLHMAQNLDLGAQYSVLGIVAVAVVLATFVGMLGITISTALIYWTGKWIGGKGKFHSVRAAVSWSNVPNIISILMWAVLIYTFNSQAFMDNFEQTAYKGMQQSVFSISLIIQAVLAIWSFIILVKGLGQAQGFSAWKGVLNVLIPFFLVGIVIWLISWAVWVATGMPGAM